MKLWARNFYFSKSWQQARHAYLNSQQNICERCGEPAKVCHHKTWLTADNITDPFISLGWDNFEALCQECHNQEHHKKKKVTRYHYDDNGNIVYAPL